MRGDRPGLKPKDLVGIPFTPHARGSTGCFPVVLCTPGVYPACAGIDLWAFSYLVTLESLPRMRGDRPPSLHVLYTTKGFTPHARGSTLT